MSKSDTLRNRDVLTGPPGLLFGLTLLVFFTSGLRTGVEHDQATPAHQAILSQNNNLAETEGFALIPPRAAPMLTVVAPQTSQRVVAQFPSGMTTALAWDPIREYWSCRFPVLQGAQDSAYAVKVKIINQAGMPSWQEIVVPFQQYSGG